MRLSWRAGLLALTFSVSACGGDDAPAGQQAAAPAGGPGGMAGRSTPAVEVQPVARGSIARQVTVSGIVEPLRTIGVNSQVSGALVAVNVQEGDFVRRGAVLARVDDRELRAQLTAAEASYEVAEAAFERAQQLRDRKVITLPEYERDRTAYAAARAQIEQLRTRVGYATLNAPATGVITEKHVEQGDVVSGNTRMFAIADVSQLVVRVGVSELDVVDLAQGDEVTVTLDAQPQRAMTGVVRRIFPGGDPQTRLVPVEVALSAESSRLARPGFLARVTFDLATSENVLLVPTSAVLGGQGAQAVFLVQNGNAVRRTVQTGLTSRGRIEIVSGLEEGDPVIITGNNTLRDGMEVRVAEPLEPRPPASASPERAAPGTQATPATRP